MITQIEGYHHIVYQEGVCNGRPSIRDTRLEPWHFRNCTINEILQSWIYLTKEQAEEALRYYKENRRYYKKLEKEI